MVSRAACLFSMSRATAQTSRRLASEKLRSSSGLMPDLNCSRAFFTILCPSVMVSEIWYELARRNTSGRTSTAAFLCVFLTVTWWDSRKVSAALTSFMHVLPKSDYGIVIGVSSSRRVWCAWASCEAAQGYAAVLQAIAASQNSPGSRKVGISLFPQVCPLIHFQRTE